MRPLISLCMIVKNEEKVIDRCLSSIVNLIDEIIVVDTGSTDNTKELVSKYTSKIYDFEWVDDFSAARNYAASKASGEWILVLDADEYVDEENFKKFINELKDDGGVYNAYTAKIINFAGNFGEHLLQNYHDRIYKNNGEISYHRKIHEQFKHNNNDKLKLKYSSLVIFHSGYLNKTVTEKNKSQRNKELLDNQVKNGKQNAFDYFNFGNEYFSLGEYEEALEAYLQAYKLKSSFQLAWIPMNLIQIIICLLRLKRYNDALNVINDAQGIFANSPEFTYLKGKVFLDRGQIEDAKLIFLELINNAEKYTDIVIRPDLKEEKPHLHLGEIFLNQENYNDAIYHFIKVLNINHNNSESIYKTIYILNKFHTEEEITEFIRTNQLVNKHNISIYVQACFNVGNPSIAIKVIEDMANEYKLLHKVALLKNLIINNIGSFEQFQDIFKPEIIKHLMESEWVNIVDIFLLRNYVSQDENLLAVYNTLKENTQIIRLIELVDDAESLVNIDGDLIIYTLNVFFTYKKYDLCNVMLEEIEKTDKNTILGVARILFFNEYKGEALQLYNLCDWNKYSEQDFINIINCLLDVSQRDSAIDVAKYALTTFDNDFRFYNYILRNTEDPVLFQTIFEKSKVKFSGSKYLEELENELLFK